jgi:hypothetical protein
MSAPSQSWINRANRSLTQMLQGVEGQGARRDGFPGSFGALQEMQGHDQAILE